MGKPRRGRWAEICEWQGRIPGSHPGWLDWFHRPAATQLPGTISFREPFGLSVQKNQSLSVAPGNLPPVQEGRGGVGKVPVSCTQGLGSRSDSEKNHLSKAILFSVPTPDSTRVANLLPSQKMGSYSHFTNGSGEAGRAKAKKKSQSHASNHPVLGHWPPTCA